MEIRVIGPGCARCRRAAAEVETAARLAGIAATVVQVEDVRELLGVSARSTPAVVVDGVLKSSGRVPSAEEIAAWLRSAPQGSAPTATSEAGASEAYVSPGNRLVLMAFCAAAIAGCALALERPCSITVGLALLAIAVGALYPAYWTGVP
jgi:small redox-active disulfide protein 2